MMASNRTPPPRLTIGLLAGWPIYGSYTADRFVEYISQGMQAFAWEHDCNIMLGLGISRIIGVRSQRTAWPVLSPDSDFIPIGPWNTDGLIVLAPLQSRERAIYLQQLRQTGFPVVFIGTGEQAPFVAVDNRSGIRQAITHLIEHGHHNIAFIAGDPQDTGDSQERLQSYQATLREFQIEPHECLIRNGYHYQEGGYLAMKQIIDEGIEFSAVAASNDTSAIGAMAALRDAGLRIPEDVAIIGFDDQPLASGQDPPLATVHYPLFEAGQRAGKLLYDHLVHQIDISTQEIRIPARLVYRQSCGCIAGDQRSWQIQVPDHTANKHAGEEITRQLRQALASQLLSMPEDDIHVYCRQITESFQASLLTKKGERFYRTLSKIMRRVEALNDDAYAWQGAITVLWIELASRIADIEVRNLAETFLHRARVMISETLQHQNRQNLNQQNQITHQLGWLSGYLFAAQNESQIIQALTQLPKLDVRFAHVGFFEAQGEDPVANVRYCVPNEDEPDGAGEDAKEKIWRFPSRRFPPTQIFPSETPYSVVILPLTFLEDAIGFIVFDGKNLEPLDAIVRQVASAIKSTRLHATILEMSITDSLTGLYNRRYFEDFLNKELERSRRYKRPLGIIMIDLDHFKEYNDTFGHQAGDSALRTIAQNIQDTIRHDADVAARYGGEEFIIALPETDIVGACRMAERIRVCVESLTGLETRLTVSIGVTACLEGSLSLEALVTQADQALYRAKNEGRNRVCKFGSSG